MVFRNRLIAAAVACVLGSTSAMSAMAQSTYEFNLPEQSLADALRAIGQKTMTNILFQPETVEKLNAPAVSGSLSAEDAIRRALAGSGLVVQGMNGNSMVVGTQEGLAKYRKATGMAASRSGSIRLAEVDASAASDASEGAQLEEIVVTAQKKEERLQDVPMSISALSGQDLDRRGASGMADYLVGVPGVSVSDLGAISNSIVIRGVATSGGGVATSGDNSNSSSGPTVSSYFDETSLTGTGGYFGDSSDIPPVDLERVEVLRGPQGTAFGDASLGGTLRFIPKKPDLNHFSARLTGGYSSTSEWGGDNSMVQGVVNIPVVPGVLAIRAVGYRYDESGYYENVVGRDPPSIALAAGWGQDVSGYVRHDVGSQLTTGGRLIAAWQPTADLSITSNLLKQKLEQNGAPYSVKGSYGDYAQYGDHYPILAPASVRGEQLPTVDLDFGLANITANYRLSWAQWTSTVSHVKSLPTSTHDYSRLFEVPVSEYTPNDSRLTTAETRLASSLAGRFQYLAGLFYQKIDNGTVDYLFGEDDAALNPFGENPIAVLDLRSQIEQRALFGELSYDLMPNLTATVGGRYFKYERDDFRGTSGALVGIPLGAPVESRLSSGESHSNFKGNLKYKLSDASTVYASWAQGFRLGRSTAGLAGVATTCDADNDGVIDGTNTSIASTTDVKSDSLDSYELGAKFAVFNRRMTLDASVYHINWDQVPVSIQVPCGNTRQSYTTNAGRATSDGADVQATILATERLKFELGVGYTNAELAEAVPAQGWREGARLPVPRWNGSFSSQYTFDLRGHEAFVRLDSVYRGSTYKDPSENPLTGTDNYTTLDIRTGLAVGSVALEIYARNLTNENAAQVGDVDFYGRQATYRIRPRVVGVQLSCEFR